MNDKLLEELNNQINLELYSAYLYILISAYFSKLNMEGFAKNMKKQAIEETEHAEKIYDFIIERDEEINLKEIKAPVKTFNTPIEAINAALEHEKVVTDSINDLYKLSKELNDPATEVFLHWFIKEQVEEEEKFRTLKDKMINIQNIECDINRLDRHFEYQNEIN